MYWKFPSNVVVYDALDGLDVSENVFVRKLDPLWFAGRAGREYDLDAIGPRDIFRIQTFRRMLGDYGWNIAKI